MRVSQVVKSKCMKNEMVMNRSKAYSARNNIVHQFESITTRKSLVTLHPWNFNFLLQKNHLLVLFTSEECEGCQAASVLFVGMLMI